MRPEVQIVDNKMDETCGDACGESAVQLTITPVHAITDLDIMEQSFTSGKAEVCVPLV